MPLAPARPGCTRAGQPVSPRPRLAGNPTARQPRWRPPRPSGPARRSRGARGAGRGPLRELLGLVVRPRPRRPEPSLPPPPGPSLCPGQGHPGWGASSLCLRPTNPFYPNPSLHLGDSSGPFSDPDLDSPSVTLTLSVYLSSILSSPLHLFFLHLLKKII